MLCNKAKNLYNHKILILLLIMVVIFLAHFKIQVHNANNTHYNICRDLAHIQLNI